MLGIEITDYQYIDKIAHGNKTIKKVLAQQLKEVYPIAVENEGIDVIPNIYQSSNIRDNWIASDAKLEVGNRIQLITEDDIKKVYEVIVIKEGAFKVNQKFSDQKVFIYGKEVDDFHTVDYDAIAMLNVSATQELANRLEKIAVENTALKKALNALKTHSLNLEKWKNRLEELEAKIQP